MHPAGFEPRPGAAGPPGLTRPGLPDEPVAASTTSFKERPLAATSLVKRGVPVIDAQRS